MRIPNQTGVGAPRAIVVKAALAGVTPGIMTRCATCCTTCNVLPPRKRYGCKQGCEASVGGCNCALYPPGVIPALRAAAA